MSYRFQRTVSSLDHDGQTTLTVALAVPVVLADVSTATEIREQDGIVADPADPNLGGNPERAHKFYFSASLSGGVKRVYVTFSTNGTSGWTTPQVCTMGGSNRQSEDPSVVTDLHAPGQVHRSGGSMFMYVEDSSTSTIYVYTSTDGIAWTEMASNPVIDRVTSSWEGLLVGSPCGRHDGSRFILGYEGIDNASAGSLEGLGVAVGSTANTLTKSAANPVWDPTVEPLADRSIVVDAIDLTADGTAFVVTAHDGIGSGTPTAWIGRTTNLDPASWVSGDIVGVGDTNTSLDRRDLTRDYASSQRMVTSPLANDRMVVRQVERRQAYLANRVMVKRSGTFGALPKMERSAGVFTWSACLPDDVADLDGWWSAHEVPFTPIDSGVSPWSAINRSGYSATQPTVAQRPILKQPSARRCLRFDGSNDSLSLGSLTAFRNVAGLTVVVLATTATTAAGTRVLFRSSGGTSGLSARVSLDVSGSALRFGGRRADADSFQSVTGGTLTTGSRFVAVGVIDYVNRTLTLRLNGVQVAASATFQTSGMSANTTALSTLIGGSSAEFHSGDIYELAIYPRALTLSEVRGLERRMTGLPA